MSLGRRSLLLGATALLGGCEMFEGILGERKVPLPGERIAVLRTEPPIAADPEAGGTITLPPPQTIGDWPGEGGPLSHAPGHIAVSERLAVAWRASIGSGTGYRQRLSSGPVIVGGVVYAADAWGTVSAFGLDDGRRRWSTETSPEEGSAVALGGGVAVADGMVYAATGAAEVLALNAADGTIAWRVRLPAGARGAPAVAEKRLFVPTTENHLVALSTEDGRRIWTHRGAALTTIPFGLPSPAVDGQTVVAGFGTGELVALRASDGRMIWAESLGGVANTSLADIVGITGLPVIDGGRVLAVGLANTAIAVDLRSGRRLWERNFGGPNGMATAGDWAFGVSRGGKAVGLGREDGRIRWVSELDPPPETGRRRDDPLRFGPPLVAGGHVLIPSSRNELLQLDPASGAVAGRVSVGGMVSLPMASSQGVLVVLTDDGTLIALR